MKYIMVIKDNYEIRDESEKEIEEKLNDGTLHISQIIDPSVRIQEVAVNKQPSNIRFIQNPDKSLLMKSIKAYPYAVQWLDNLEERFLLAALRANPMAIEFIKEKNINYKIRRAALKANPLCAQFLTDFTEEEIHIIYENEPEALRFAVNSSSEWLLKAVSKKPSTIIIFEKSGIIGRPDKDHAVYTRYWDTALKRDPYLAYYLTEEEQLYMIDAIKAGLLSTNYIQSLTQLTPKVRDIIMQEIKPVTE